MKNKTLSILSIFFFIFLFSFHINALAISSDSHCISGDTNCSTIVSSSSSGTSFLDKIGDFFKSIFGTKDKVVTPVVNNITNITNTTPPVVTPPPTTIIQQISQAGLTGNTGPQGLRGFTGLQGPKGDKGEPGLSINSSSFVSKSFLTSQVDRIYDSTSNSIQGLSLSLGKEINTKLLTVTGDATIGGNILLTGTILGSNLSGSASGLNTGDNAINSLYSGLATSKQDSLNGTGFVKISGTTISYDNSTYLTSLSGAVLTSQTTPQTIGLTDSRLSKLWATDLDVTNTITGSISGNAGTVTNGLYSSGSYSDPSWLTGLNATKLTTGTGAVTLGAGGTNQNVTITPSGTGYTILNGNVGIGTTNPGVPMQIGTNNSSGDDSAILLTRNLTTGLGATGGHGVRDESDWNTNDVTGLLGYASFDAITLIRGSAPFGHYAGFQARPVFLGTNTMGAIRGYTFYPRYDGTGTVGTSIAMDIANPSGTGTVVSNYGIYIQPLTRGTTNNLAILTGGSTPSYFGGTIQTGANVTAAGVITGSNLRYNFSSRNLSVGSTLLAGNYNTFIGDTGDPSGMFNTLLGPAAGNVLTTGGYNTMLGAYAGLANQGSGNVFIGAKSAYYETGSNTLMIDNQQRSSEADARTKALIYGVFDIDPVNQKLVINGFVGIGNTSPAVALHVGSTSVVDHTNLLELQDINSVCTFNADTGSPSCGSDITLKKNINNQTDNLTKILALQPVTYNWLTDQEGAVVQHGFIAQAVAEVMPELVHDGIWTDGTTRKFLQMSGMIPYMVGAIKDLDLKLEDLTNTQIGMVDETGTETFVGRFFDRIKSWLADTGNGIAKIFVEEVDSNKIKTDTLCIGSTCVTESQLQTLLQNSSISNTGGSTTGTGDSGNTDNAQNTDVCPNIDGVQAEIPAGDEINTDGQCVAITGGDTGSVDESKQALDTTAPVITLSGESLITLKVGDPYTEAGATATDDIDASVTVNISGTVDTAITGTYTIKYNAKDTAENNATEVTRTVTVE